MTRAALLLSLLSALTASPALAQGVNADVQAVIDNAAAAYRKLSFFSATIDLTQGLRRTNTKLVLSRVGKLSAEITQGTETRRVVADGTTVFSDTSRERGKYIKQPGTSLDEALLVLQQRGGAGIGLLPILLQSRNAEQQLFPVAPEVVERQPSLTIMGVSCDVIAGVLSDETRKYTYSFAFGKSDHLLQRLAISPVGGEPIITELYSNVTTKPLLTDESFAYTPLKGAVASTPPKLPPSYDERLKPGALPLKLTGVDLVGKEVTLDDYKGKVLLIDFWATWCGPCLAELPNVLEAYHKYQGQGFDVLGISLDREADREKLLQLISQKNLPWRQIYDGREWEAANAKSYGVRAIPFTVLVGRDGKISAVGIRGEKLAPAIEAALAVK